MARRAAQFPARPSPEEFALAARLSGHNAPPSSQNQQQQRRHSGGASYSSSPSVQSTRPWNIVELPRASADAASRVRKGTHASDRDGTRDEVRVYRYGTNGSRVVSQGSKRRLSLLVAGMSDSERDHDKPEAVAKATKPAEQAESKAEAEADTEPMAVDEGGEQQAAAAAEPEQAEPQPATLRSFLDNPELLERLSSADTGAHASAAAADADDLPEGICVNCEEAPAVLMCNQCRDEYCDMCFTCLHRKGKRAEHTTIRKEAAEAMEAADPTTAEASAAAAGSDENAEANGESLMSRVVGVLSGKKTSSSEATPSTEGTYETFERYSPDWFEQRAKYIPVRLSLKQRKHLRLAAAVLGVSHYTDRVDIPFRQAARRLHAQMENMCSVFSGVVLGINYDRCKEAVQEREFEQFSNALSIVFEITQRHKIMNPEKMRGDYGKLMYLMQDTKVQEVRALTRVEAVKDIQSVYGYLEDNGIKGVLRHPDLKTATQEILPHGKSRPQIQREIKDKERAQDRIAREFCSRDISRDEIKWCLYSIGDNFSFLRSNRLPIEQMIDFLKQYFSPDEVEEGYSLAIASGGTEGHRLTHNHARHYNYVLQSLTLWSEIVDDMFRLWYLAGEDILGENPYKLTDTGQGLHRVQNSPRVGSAMRAILFKTQQRLGNWVGSSVIHLGDTNVPNALMFIDKYTQVSKILAPIVSTLNEITRMCQQRGLCKYIDTTFGGPEQLRKDILYDFFKFGFDGSGADNFFDAGSCIDGRLTSAWNWCSQLEQKPFFPVFRLSGFVGFDGEFQQ